MTGKNKIETTFRLALAQANPTVGDVTGNAGLARRVRAEAADKGADLVFFTELFLAGYPPEDLVLKRSFQLAIVREIEALAAETADGGPGLLIGAPWVEPGGGGDTLHNSMALLDGGEIRAVRHKVHLPNYGTFDEMRVFKPGPIPGPVNFRGLRLGVPICEDAWHDDVAECLAETGAEILLVPNGSPFWHGKHDIRLGHMVARVVETGLPLVYLNQVGGQDELVFDGAGFVLNADRSLAAQLPAFAQTLAITDWTKGADGWTCAPGPDAELPHGDDLIYRACVTGLGDYVRKNRFPGVIIGLSGGIDSALTAAMAVDALGADKVVCVMMPSRFTSAESLKDAAACAKALGVRLDTVSIDPIVDGFQKALEPLFKGTAPGVTEENIQSRARGVILMAISNKFGAMVVTTGNKSEMSVGYATLYGDMAGGYNPLKDLYKTEVYSISAFRNQNLPRGCLGSGGEVIPANIITKAPTAELRENQTDQDSLPPYEVLDDILHGLVEKDASRDDLVARGHSAELVGRIEHMLYIAEYKRRQAAPGVKISAKNFGRDRRYPITNGFRDRG
ncbi:NAD synthetase / Glutamine amidotransferase chain of NAD synthetase [hydrothermal vent metagenome]|uniref:NAD(+) synthase (glutamine-hydrolyzing) n=1 Tax=hydrothermal vent metagenome TaxID=652676 RepID=A0A3B0TD10_9ZZZZ